MSARVHQLPLPLPVEESADRQALRLALAELAYVHWAIMGGEPSRFSRAIAECERLTGLLPWEPGE